MACPLHRLDRQSLHDSAGRSDQRSRTVSRRGRQRRIRMTRATGTFVEQRFRHDLSRSTHCFSHTVYHSVFPAAYRMHDAMHELNGYRASGSEPSPQACQVEFLAWPNSLRYRFAALARVKNFEFGDEMRRYSVDRSASLFRHGSQRAHGVEALSRVNHRWWQEMSMISLSVRTVRRSFRCNSHAPCDQAARFPRVNPKQSEEKKNRCIRSPAEIAVLETATDEIGEAHCRGYRLAAA